MARPTTKQRKIRDAQDLLDNQALESIFKGMESDIFERWVTSTDKEARERLHADITAARKLKECIYASATDRA